MAILISCLLVLGACYSPDLPDCRVRCETAADCAPGQTCTDHACSGAALCPSDARGPGDDPAGDAAVDPTDGPSLPPIDAPPDAAPSDAALGVLAIRIEDKGSVSVSGAGSCSDAAPDHTCMFGVVIGVPLTLQATPGMNRRFENWSESCSGNLPTCILTPTAAMTRVTAKFHKDD